MNFKPGDHVRIISTAKAKEGLECLVGQECHLVRSIMFDGDAKVWWVIDIQPLESETVVREDAIRHIYDGTQKTSWEDCVFQPREMA